MHVAGKVFVKTCLRVIRDTIFPNMWNFPMCDTFIQQERKAQNLRLAGKPPSPVPSISGTSWFPHERHPKSGWSTYCNDFLSKEKIYSM